MKKAIHRKNYSRHFAALIVLFVSLQASGEQPNVILILADDLGFSDIAPFGSEISTPSITALAENGVSFTNYHTSASCAPTRGMLLTGVDSHRNGVPNIPEAIPPEQASQANYKGVLGNNVVTVATLLQGAGYHTYMAGKWHLGKTANLLPSSRGFERTVAMADTGSDNWEQKPYIPIYEKANWYADGKETTLPEDFYSSRYLIDKTIEFIDSNRGDGSPFFAYVPFQAVHIPVQAPKAFIDKYMGVYDEGWTVLREQRQARAKQLGIVPETSDMVTMSTTSSWDILTDSEKSYHAKRMAVYAGMVDAMDFHIGRLVDYLKSTGQFENTVFIFTSDNGSEASGSDNFNNKVMRFGLGLQDYNNDYETLGAKGSYSTIGPSFASAAASPLSYYKFYAGEGGLRVPLVISGNSIAASRQKTNAFSYVTDITPTILEIAGVARPGQHYGGRLVEPIIGKSLLPLLKGEANTVYSEDDVIGYELGGHAALFQGDYKIVNIRGPVGDDIWHLYNIVSDPGETIDLREKMPGRFLTMLENYQVYVRENGVLPVPEGYQQVRQVLINGMRDRFGDNILILLFTLIIMIPLYFTYRFAQRKNV